MTRLVAAIQSGVWAIRPQEALAHLHIAMRIVKGDLVQTAVTPSDKVKSTTYIDENGVRNWQRSAMTSESIVAIYDIQGVITKSDQMCGPDGTVTLMRNMMKADRDPSVKGHLLSIDSGGGEATNISEVSRFIRSNIQKPVVAHFNGLMASAAYGIGAAADEIYATLETDICGSVGVMMTLADWKAYYEKEGLKVFDIYADQSTLKNDDFHKALEGDFEPIKNNLLNPFATSFINSIKELRPATTEHSDIFKGKTYMAIEARDNGLIDGMMTQQQAINRVFELAASKSNQSKSNQITEMKIFGIEIGGVAKAEDGSVTLSAEQYAKLTADSDKVEATQQVVEELKGELESVKAEKTQLAETVTAVLARLETLEAKPAAAPAQANGVQEPKTEKAWEKYNQSVQQDMTTGKRLFS